MSDASADARANYENTKRTAPVPPGKMLTEPQDVNPNVDPVWFWNSMEQCWQDLQFTNGEVMEVFNKLFVAGATCIVVRDPNYVAPPPPPMPSFGTNLPFATPSAPPAIAPIPQAQPTIPVVPQVQAAPVIPVAVPVIPVAQPVVQVSTPAPLFNPAAPVLPTPTLGLPTVEQTLGVAPSVSSFAPIPPAPVATEEESEDESGDVSAADPNEVSAWLIARDAVKAQIDKLEEVENELRTRIVKTCFPDGLREGANKCALPDGRKLTITGVVNRTVDDALVQTGLEALQKHLGMSPVGLFKTKYEVSKAVLKTLPADAKALLANVITEKKGSPQLKVSEVR